jgi:hypothetical protein
MGANYFQTPRETIKDFVSLLNILEQDPSRGWEEHLGKLTSGAIKPDKENGTPDVPTSGNDDLTEFRL